MSDEKDWAKDCIFCKIVAGDDEKTTILHADDTYVVFRDIKPATPHHYLIVPRQHIKDPKHLTGDHIELVEGLLRTAHEFLEKGAIDAKDARFGFHWPPFTTVNHLHMHAIAATAEMGWIGRGIFKPNSFWFVTVDWLLERLKKMKQT